MTKEEAYSKLFKLDNPETQKYVLMLARSSEVPEEVINYLAQETSVELPSWISNLSSKKFYKTLEDKSISDLDKAIALSSLITHLLIECRDNPDNVANLGSEITICQVIDWIKGYLENKSAQPNPVIVDLIQSVNKETSE